MSKKQCATMERERDIRIALVEGGIEVYERLPRKKRNVIWAGTYQELAEILEARASQPSS